MITSGYHPKAGNTALRLAQLFAARVRHSRDGHFVFAADATARALGVSRRTVMYAAKHLRELGLIAYVEHGTKTNVRRTKGTWKPGDGYRATATIFAAVAPPAYDEARSRRLSGHGYHARIIGVTSHGRRAIAEARRKATQSDRTRCTPSVVVSTDHLQVQVDGGINYTSRTRAKRKTPTTHHRTTSQRCARNITATQQLQTEIWWLHRTCSRKLAYALRPLLDAGWTAQSLAAEIQTWGVPGHLRNPIAYVHHERARRQHTGDLPPTHAPAPQPAHTLAADETAERYTVLLRSLDGTNTPAWQHYETQLRPGLRNALAARRAKVPVQPSRHVARLREPESYFWQSLAAPGSFSVLGTYRRRTRGAYPPRQPDAEAREGWMEALRDQQSAERAFAALRAELDERAGR
ncbi:hypothetical protein [Streptomyces angustmyceticus]|uniref:hypothetical protein n=1 Tax=Streptomyces angustmyceticus TaxID=285578 RepID=UPI003D8F2DB7